MSEQLKDPIEAVSLGDVVTEIETRRNALAEILKEAVSNESNPDKLQKILDLLRSKNEMGSSSIAQGFQEVYAGRYSTLEVRPSVHGKREVHFSLKGGLDNLEAARNEINEAMKSAPNYPKEDFTVYLSGNNDLPKGRDVAETYTPVIRGSGGRVRLGTDPTESHEALLNSLGLKFVNNDLHRLACGAFRVKAGFPEDPNQIGTTSDQGDLNEGMVVRTEKGSCSGAAASFRVGVGGYDQHGDCAFDYLVVRGRGSLVVAGASSRN